MELSERKWGVSDYSWVFTPCSTFPKGASAAMTQWYVAWNLSRRHITWRRPGCQEEIDTLSLWTKNGGHNAGAEVGCLSNQQRVLWRAGLKTMADISCEDGSLKTWEDFPEGTIPRSARRSLNKLVGTITRPTVGVEEAHSICNFFVTSGNLYNGSTVWELRGQRKEIKLKWAPGELVAQPLQTYVLINYSLVKKAASILPEDATFHRLTIGRSKSPSSTSTIHQVIAYVDELAGLADKFCWRDGCGFFHSDTAHLRMLLAGEFPPIHANISKWSRELRWVPDADSLWRNIWLPYRSNKENTFFVANSIQSICNKRMATPGPEQK